MTTPKVCSHQRSGTHLLAASIKKNFHVGNVSGAIEVEDQSWYKTGKSESGHMPWFDLIGSHKQYPHCKSTGNGFSDKQILYIVRDPIDTMWSYFHFLRDSPATPGMTGHEHPSKYKDFEEWICPESISYWRRHLNSFKNNEFPVIRFEKLIRSHKTFAKEMEKVKNKFGLDKKGNYSPVNVKVGWSPREGRTDYDKEMDSEEIIMFREVLGSEFFGYVI